MTDAEKLRRAVEEGEFVGGSTVIGPILVAEIGRLRAAIREHRDQRGDDRCHLDDRRLYAALGDGQPAETALPPKCEFLASCERFWEQRQRPGEKVDGPRSMTIRQMEIEIGKLRAENTCLKEAFEERGWSEHFRQIKEIAP